MATYQIKTLIGKENWQQITQVREHEFISDNVAQDAGPSPVEYLCGSVNSCIGISAAMIIKGHRLDVTNFKIESTAETEKLTHSQSKIKEMTVKISFDSDLDQMGKKKFIEHVLWVSTVYQSLKEAFPIKIEY